MVENVFDGLGTAITNPKAEEHLSEKGDAEVDPEGEKAQSYAREGGGEACRVSRKVTCSRARVVTELC